MSFQSAWRICICALLLVFPTGCFQLSNGPLDEEKDPHFIEGKKRINGMDYDGAIDSFERALQANPKSGAAHLELAILYDQRKNDAVSALYHYHRHLQLRKDSPMADVVAQNMAAAKRELAKSVSVAVVNRDMQRDLERLTTTNSAMRERLGVLEAELTRRPQFLTNFVTNWLTVTQFLTKTVEAPPVQQVATPEPRSVERIATTPRPTPSAPTKVETRSPVAQTPRPAAQQPVASATRRYTVRSGDTFARIARQFGISQQALTKANPRVSPTRLRPGQIIVIPGR